MTIETLLYLAPIRGLTDSIFRDTFQHHFGGFDLAVAPFINPQKSSLYPDSMLSDVLPENNKRLPVIPQLLQIDATSFITLANRLADLGYREANWNLGCPAPMVAKKKRGSGLLPYPDTIIQLLEEVLPRIEIKLSLKTRLGYFEPDEILTLLPRLDPFPLTEIILHPRLGRQLYRGHVDLEGFAACTKVSKHQIVYNGDITDSDQFNHLTERFPDVNRWMIGRGAIANPFLPEEIQNTSTTDSTRRYQRLSLFHEELFSRLQDKLDGPGHLLGRLKPIWTYLIASFPEQKKMLKKIHKCKSVDVYLNTVHKLFMNAEESCQ